MNKVNVNKTVLFHGLSDEEVAAALDKLAAVEKSFKKGYVILHAGSNTDKLGLVLAGSVTIESNDMWGNRTILSHVSVGQFFAETYALLEDTPMLVDATAGEDCTILFLKIGSLKRLISEKNSWAPKMIANLLTISAHKNLTLSGRSFHTSPKTIRGRVEAYLNSVALRTGSTEFGIPFDRQQLADYLNVERTALSKELGKMQDDGIIEYQKNHFVLLN